MSDVRTVARNTIFLTFAQVIVIICGMISMKLTTTGLGVEDYGLFGYANSLNTLICSLMDLGLATLTARELARNRSLAGKYLANFLTIRLLLAILVFTGIITAGYLGLLPAGGMYVVFIVSLSVIFSVLTGIFTAIFQSFEKMEYISAQTAITSVLTMLAAAIMYYFKLDVFGYSVLYSLAYMIVLIYCVWVCASKFTMPRLAINPGFWKESIRESLPFGITNIFGIVYYQFGTIYLQYKQNEIAVGVFRAPFNLFMTILFVPQVLTTVLYPVMSRHFIASQGSMQKVFNKFLKYITIIAFPMGVGTTILADKIMYTFTNAQYSGSVVVLQILIWAAVFIFMSNAFSTLLNSSNMQRTSMIIGFICMILNVVLNIWLVPTYSSIGVAVATTATEFVMLALLILVCLRLKNGLSRDTIVSLAKSGISSLIMGAYLLYFRQENLILLAITAATLYFIVLYLLRTLDKEDTDIIKSIVLSKINMRGA
jgi:O-antigen/teichoic acid export membrane protein